MKTWKRWNLWVAHVQNLDDAIEIVRMHNRAVRGEA